MKRKYYEENWQTYLECLKCWEYKTLDHFSKKWWRPFWVRTWCRLCDSEYWKSWRENNHERHLKSSREYHENHREHDREYNREYRKTHKESWDRSAKRYPEKRRARYTTYNYIKYNHIQKPTDCCVCKQSCKCEIHHPDYNLWNKVVFCCRRCHSLIHRWDVNKYTIVDLLKQR